jgi:AcrR family transcriptional regulator
VTPRLSREESRRRTRAAILDAAERAFSELGYRGASLDGIALAAGFSKGAVYSNFSSKAELFLELMDRQAEQDEHGVDGRAAPAGGQEWALATLDFLIEAVRDPAIQSSLAQRYKTARTRTAARLGADSAPPAWATWDEIGTIAMALGSGLIIQTMIDPDAVAPDLFARTMTRLLADRP